MQENKAKQDRETGFDKQRYRGHISLCEIDLLGQKSISKSKVAIIGVGGLGSPVSLYLAAAGVGTMVVVDADRVSRSNLQRQIAHFSPDEGKPKTTSAAEKIAMLNPAVNVVEYREKLTAENASRILEGVTAVADCTDSFESRLLVSRLCKERGIPCVTASVSRFNGQIFTWTPGHKGYDEIFGDSVDETNDEPRECAVNGVLNTAVGVMGTLQATEIIKIVAGAWHGKLVGELLTDRLLTFDALTMSFREYEM